MHQKNITNCSSCIHCPRFEASIFNQLNATSIAALDEIKKDISINKGSYIFNEGAKPKGLFCIKSGKVKITQMGPDGKDQIVDMLKNGDILGHRAILGQDKYSCSAQALEDTKICFFPQSLFYSLAENNGKLILRFAHLLANELKEAERKITSTAQQPVLIRIADSLLRLQKKYGEESGTSAINIAITREELANLASTTRESATRSLYKLKQLGIIELAGKKIKIVDSQKLLLMTQ
jgi:CRP-like cAMP-binding protein